MSTLHKASGAVVIAGVLTWLCLSSCCSTIFWVLSGALLVYLASGGWRTIWVLYMTFPRDFGCLWRYIKIRRSFSPVLSKNVTVAKRFVSLANQHPQKTAFIFEGRRWSFKEINEYSNKIAHYLLSIGLRRLDAVALFMENRPEYVATWIGCAKIGVATGLINSNLRLTPLLHSIKAAKAKAVICGTEMQQAINDIFGDLAGCPVLVSGAADEPKLINSDFVNLDECLKNSLSTVPDEINDCSVHDSLLYIYTSGTTGLPKAAVIKNHRYSLYTTALHYFCDVEDSVVYNPLPLYHTAGGLIGAGQAVVWGCTVVIRKKFSVSSFWSDIIKYDCEVAQYIGEMCRYLMNAPPKSEDTKHKLHVMLGNGLRPQIWDEFVRRFKIPRMAEIYGATEGIANLINFDGKPGACGFLPVLFLDYFPAKLIRVDKETGEPIRGNDGLCIMCKAGEPGLYIGMIQDDPALKFHGYSDKKASQKKVVHNVCKLGDSAYMSGDVLVMDELGYVYFKDRLGDTFRWKGENVSTTEVEGVVSTLANNNDAVVYGVEIPNAEGKAGMAAIVDPERSLNVEKFAGEIVKFLPSYAIPIFLRIVDDIDKTGTYKLRKVDLQKEGYDIRTIKDTIYFFEGKKKRYTQLTKELYDVIAQGKSGH